MALTSKDQPFYRKATTILIGLIALTYALYVLRDIMAPVAFSLIIAILLNPSVNYLQKKKVNRILAISLSLLMAVLVIGGLVYFISAQLVSFTDSWPQFKAKFNEHFHQIQAWLANDLNISMAQQQKMLKDLSDSGQKLAGGAIGGIFGILGFFVLIPIYVFLMLFYKTLLLNFLHEIFTENKSTQVAEILTETKSSIQSYMVGLLLEALVVAVLNSTALLILGVEYAILLGVIGALLNMLPYIGGIIAIALPVLMAAVTKDGFTTPVAIIGAYTLIQFIDNNFLVPFLVSSRVKINALASIIVVLLGGALWGVSGMFLSIPFVAILKIIFDRLPDTKPWGKLLGDEIPTRHKGEIWMRRKAKKASVAEKIVDNSAKP